MLRAFSLSVIGCWDFGEIGKGVIQQFADPLTLVCRLAFNCLLSSIVHRRDGFAAHISGV